MTSVARKKSKMIENLDRISELPEPIILHILSYLPLQDSARASILSKAWNNYCSLYPILHFDHNLFALKSLISAKQGSGKPNINQISDMFMDDIDCRLSKATQLVSPIRKLALTIAINDPNNFSRVDKWLELVKQINVQEICFSMQSAGYLWENLFDDASVLYEFPISVLASKGLRTVYIRGCKFSDETVVGDSINKRGISFFSLQRLCLSHVYIKDHVFENLTNYCKGIEILVLDYCTVLMDSMELSKFPKLKNALIEIEYGWIDRVAIEDTNLECFKCDVNIDTECHISPAACASIRELTLVGCTINQPSLFADLAATFPLVEEAEIFIHDTETFKANSKLLRKLKFTRDGSVPLKEVHIDCPSLTLLDCSTFDLMELYVDCPKLRVFQYDGSTVPKQLFFSSAADLEESSCNLTVNYAYDTFWFINLRAFLVCAMAVPTYVSLLFTLLMATFEPEQIEAIQASSRYNVHLQLSVTDQVEQNVAALVDAVLWTIRPTTLTFGYSSYYLIKYLCENLIKKSLNDTSDEQPTNPCWMHQLKDFKVESSLDILDIKDNLAALPEQCRTTNDICFKLHWSYE
ncbi:hypothetical protein RND81_10G000500 [Saponaria officinalis]|uniref:F-box domain-containing protein n=1 Tax=Saponaria officinalis TaxID=3572 RepID=A0AAW1HXD1_SAPOF